MTQMTEKKKPLIILTGPTAVGKTAASIGLAKAIGGEIISADSMQVYRHMDIGSAKILPEEMKGVKHYLIDVLNPEEEFNVAVFQKMAKDAMVEIYKRGRIPIVVGGTGFYIQALLYDIDFEKGEENTAYRKKLETYAKEHGAQALHDRLREADPKSADAIHANNVKRVIRALEYYHETGTKISEHNEAEREKDSPYRFAYFVLNDVRSRLYERIDRRVDLMVEQGLVDEVTALKTRGCTREMVSMQGLGYKEILDYLEKHKGESGIIYCSTRKNVDNVYLMLRKNRIAAVKLSYLFFTFAICYYSRKCENNYIFCYYNTRTASLSMI